MKTDFLKYMVTIIALIFLVGAAAGFKMRPNTITLEPTNTISLIGEVNTESTSLVAANLLLSTANPVYLYIKSPGGSVMDGMRLASIIENTDKEVICIGDIAISMAFALMQACDTRLVTETSIMMQHVASYGLEPQPAPNANSFIKFMNSMVEQLDIMQADRLGMTVKELKDITRDDWWLYGHKAVTSNVADKLVNVVCSPAMLKAERKEKKASFFGTVELVWYMCPLIDMPKSIIYPNGIEKQDKDKFENSLDLRKIIKELSKK